MSRVIASTCIEEGDLLWYRREAVHSLPGDQETKVSVANLALERER